MQCQLHVMCGREALDAEEGLCILHSNDPEKDKESFKEALAEHRNKGEDDFSYFVFPGDVDFWNVSFVEPEFSHATFSGMASFRGAKFTGVVNFRDATFTESCSFYRAVFSGDAEFMNANFMNDADFSRATFAEKVNVRDATFSGTADFSDSKFVEWADFFGTVFKSRADFTSVKFTQEANFGRVAFVQGASFYKATFGDTAKFLATRFGDEVNFVGANFKKLAQFTEAEFMKGSRFYLATFAGPAAFDGALFLGKTLFAPEEEDGQAYIFSGVEVYFRDVTVEPLDALTFRDADLTKCRFQGTDLRKAEITNASWPEMDRTFPLIPRRFGIYDEVVLLQKLQKRNLQKDQTPTWSHIERVYRELKQNYEDRRDYERARDFHYGEKEMRRKNPATGYGLKLLLYVYWLVSGYGEKALRPLVCTAVLLLICTFLYLAVGIASKGGAQLSWTNLSDWPEAVLYSFRVMTLLKPDELEPVRDAKMIHTLVYTVESIAGPVLLGLFGLALRQRLKR